MTFVTFDHGYRCYESPDGIRRRFIGCLHGTPRAAIAHTVPVYVSPTRSESGAPYPSGNGRVANRATSLSEAPFSEAPGILGGNVAPHPRSLDLPPVTGDHRLHVR